METRELIAYALIALIVVAGTIALAVRQQRAKRRRLRLRGIKTHEQSHVRS